MPFQTRVTKLLGIKHPVIMGGMTGCGTPELCAAVSNAGGLGTFAIHNAGTPEKAREWIRRTKQLTDKDKPFGVNLTILPSMNPPDYEGFARVIIEEGVKIVETAGSNPKKWVTLFKTAGLITIHKCVTIRHAKSAEKMGVDIISLDGFECAGHPGEDDIGNFVLQAKGAKVLKTPFVCSGGVGDGKQLAAALALGAEGVNCGTRFCATKECNWPQTFKQSVVDGDERSSARVFKNKVAQEVVRISKEKGMDLQFTDVMHLVMGSRGREAEKNDDPDGGIWTAGQVTGLINDLPSCAELMDRIIEEAEATIKSRLTTMITSNL